MGDANDQTGKTMVITGATAGIGKATAEALCARGARVVLACRSESKTQPLLQTLQERHGPRAAAFVPLDLADLESVRRAAAQILALDEPLHVLINNAGIGGIRGLTAQGYELTFGTNHLGHFLFTLLLEERLKASAPARVVNVSSRSHLAARGIPFAKLTRETGFLRLPAYATSKLANNLFTVEHARRLAGTGVTTYAVHPGVVMSEIWRPLPTWLHKPMFVLRGMVTNEEGARTSVWCATAPELAAQSGLYYAKEREARSSRLSRDQALARQLWEWSERAVGLANPPSSDTPVAAA